MLRARPDVAEVEAFGERLHASLPRGAARARGRRGARLEEALAAAGLEVEQARPILPSLEDVFIRRMRDDAAALPGARRPGHERRVLMVLGAGRRPPRPQEPAWSG